MKFKINFQLNKKDIEKGLKLPKKMSKELAEMVGIHFGDGHMQNKFNYTNRLYYSFNSRDKNYVVYVKELFYTLFNIKMKISTYKNRKAINLYFYSKTLCTFFSKNLDIPYGAKKKLSIPKYIKENKEYLISFLRGLFDTDGCITKKRMGKYSYDLIKICTSIESFAYEIKSSLVSLGIEAYICRKKHGYDVVVGKKIYFNKFLKLIKPKNIRWGYWDFQA